VQPLAQRVLGEQCVDLADDLLMATGRQVRINSQLRGRLAQLLEPTDLRRRERLVGQVRERVAAKQRRASRAAFPRAPASESRRSKRRTSTSSGSIRSS